METEAAATRERVLKFGGCENESDGLGESTGKTECHGARRP